MIYQAKHPMIMFVSFQHRFDWPDIQDMLKLAEDTDADIVVAPIKQKGCLGINDGHTRKPSIKPDRFLMIHRCWLHLRTPFSPRYTGQVF
jgi:hypothetical protein